MRRKVLTAVRTIALIYGGLLVVMSAFQRQLIYFPDRASQSAMLDLARGADLEPWRDAHDEIVGWRTPAVERGGARNVAVVFHGNAGHALHRTYFVRGFASMPDADDWQIHVFEYPGYGARSGRPSEEAIKQAADEAVRTLSDTASRVFLIGESLGSGIACHLAGRYPEQIAGVLLITPFTSLVDVARHHYPILPVGWLLKERYDNSQALKDYRGPVAFLLAGRDEVIPTRLGRRLHEQYKGLKMLVVQEDRTHNTMEYEQQSSWWRDVAEFLLQAGYHRRPPNQGS